MFRKMKFFKFRIATLLLIISSFLVSSLIISAKADSSPNQFPASAAIQVLSDKNKSFRMGTNEHYPLKYQLNFVSEDLVDNYKVINGEGEFPIRESGSGKYSVIGNLNYMESAFIVGRNFSYAQPVPIVVSEPLNLGRVTFKFSSDKLNPGGEQIVKEIARTIANSKLLGIYLVGNADRVGSNWFNLYISKKRVERISSILESELKNLSVEGFKIYREYMSDYLSSSESGKRNESDRSVTFMVFPN